MTESEPERLEQGLATIKRRLGRQVERGRLSRERHDRTLARLKGVESVDGFAESDLVIEAVVEELPLKKDLFEQLGEVCKPEAILASNTSSLSLSEMAASSGRPEQVIGIHFFNPPTVLPLVEVISSESTSQETIDAAMAFCDSIDRLTVRGEGLARIHREPVAGAVHFRRHPHGRGRASPRPRMSTRPARWG